MEALSIKRTAFILVLMFASYLSTSHAASSDVIGHVIWAKNTLKAQLPQATPRVLTRSSEIYEHDTLMTDGVSTGEVIFTDDSTITLQENSRITIDQYRHGDKTPPNQDAFVVNVLEGGFRTVTGAISKNHPDGYKATTAVATIGVMGTIYSVYFDPTKKKMIAKLDKGSIVISNSKGRVTLIKCASSNKKGVKTAGCVDKLSAEVDGDEAPYIITTSEPGLVGSFCIS